VRPLSPSSDVRSCLTSGVAWRYAFAGGRDQIVSYHTHDGRTSRRPQFLCRLPFHSCCPAVVAALSGPGGATLRLFTMSSGELLLEKRLHAPEMGRLEAPAQGSAVAFFSAAGGGVAPDLVVLTNAHEVRRLDGVTGELKWAWSAPDQG
jgi:hypothetical protein